MSSPECIPSSVRTTSSRIGFGVYADGSASFYISDKTGDKLLQLDHRSTRGRFRHRDCGDVKTWFDKELAAGRAKAGES